MYTYVAPLSAGCALACPTQCLKVPIWQAVHTPASPAYPASHRQRSRGTPGAGDCELSGQLIHAAGPASHIFIYTQ